MIYLVSNIHRSGSSMMMRCLTAGGLVPVYDKEADIMNISGPDDYVPNPNGFFQFTYEIGENFATLYDGKLIKCPIRSLIHLPIHNYKLVFIKRDPTEIRASMGRWTPYTSWGKDEVITYMYNWYLNKIFTRLQARGDFDITILNYAEIVANPVLEFTKLSSWGIDVNAAAALVDDSLYRHRLETT